MSWSSFALSGDLSSGLQALVLGVVALSVILVAFELYRERKGSSLMRVALFVISVLGSLSLGLSLLRPVTSQVVESDTPKVAHIWLDASVRGALPSNQIAKTRLQKSEEFAEELIAESKAQGISTEFIIHRLNDRISTDASELQTADAHYIFSDGQLPRDLPSQFPLTAREHLYVKATAETLPPDHSVFEIGVNGSPIAHEPFFLKVQLRCFGGVSCADEKVVVRELLEGVPPRELAVGEINFEYEGELSLPLTLDRAGDRIIEVEWLGHESDAIVANNKRIFPLKVRRDRLRILHVAGRPTYDVRALRLFLKRDPSIDLISFFILRTRQDQSRAAISELALIPFPVEELFTEHLPSFDAIVLQDIDAKRYDLDVHFQGLADYVKGGGGLILVGGPSSFSAGGYANTPLEAVLPVELPRVGEFTSQVPFTPAITEFARSAPALRPLRQLIGQRLPEVSGTNRVGKAKPNAFVAWEHPQLKASQEQGAAPMPLLILGEAGDGRSIALTLDDTHKLGAGELGEASAGQAHAALWQGLLGWLMRDPRYENTQAELRNHCLTGRELEISVRSTEQEAQMQLTVTPMGMSKQLRIDAVSEQNQGDSLVARFQGFAPGGYVARASSVSQKGGASRFSFACEQGGSAFADPRPLPDSLRKLSERLGGRYFSADEALPAPDTARLVLARSVKPWLPTWLLSSAAALFLALAWWLRRSIGYL